jgi:hypothetical protein
MSLLVIFSVDGGDIYAYREAPVLRIVEATRGEGARQEAIRAILLYHPG